MIDLTEAQIRALRSVDAALSPHRWSLIGATAIRCWIRMPRPTHDVDFAVGASGADVFVRLTDAGWSRRGETHTWTRDGTKIDVVPASDEDIASGIVAIEPGVTLSVVGFDLAFTHFDMLTVGSGLAIPVPKLPVLVLLKMIAWTDRPHVRTKDLGDLLLILEEALDDLDPRRWDPPLSTLGFDHELQSAYWVGFELGQIAGPAHLHCAQRFLDRLRDDDSTEFALLLRQARSDGDATKRVRARLTAFERGLEAGSSLGSEMIAIPIVAPARIALPAAGGLYVWGRSGSLQMMLHDAIDRKQVVRFAYESRERIVEPHVLGTKGGRLQVLTWQIGGASSRGRLPAWRRFFVDEISGGSVTGATFAGPRRTGSWRRASFDRKIAVVR